ncbi:pyridoxamine 5'-phosphate oxidase [Acetobacteraceae bacterium]|nr:pyridoxamine 5'-phosphate oxidase [Acetobacteraceae bacterium]
MPSHISEIPTPFSNFESWMREAESAGEKSPEAMTVATATRNGRPSARILLLKHFDQNGFVFYTNSNSRKGSDLEENPFAALLFFWKTLDKQVRIEGKISRISAEEADAYFKTRPRLSKIGAHISQQSTVLESRKFLEEQLNQQKKLFEAQEDIPRPDYWNGYRLEPILFEFWEARPFRLHNRVQWLKTNDLSAQWKKELLYP